MQGLRKGRSKEKPAFFKAGGEGELILAELAF